MGDYKSEDKDKPDKIKIKVTEIETFETEYGININAIVGKKEMAIPIQNFNSANTSLLKLWNNNIQNGKIRKGVKFALLTWLGVSKKAIRRYNVLTTRGNLSKFCS